MRWSRLTGWTYVDNDAVLAEVTGHPLPEAAKLLGWDGLHDAEVTCLQVILDRPGPFVAGAAASVVERVDGRALLREAYVVYLRASVETLVQRVGSVLDDPGWTVTPRSSSGSSTSSAARGSRASPT